MSHSASSVSKLSVNPVALSCYSVAVCSFAVSVLGLPFSHWPSGALAGVGGFYLIVGLFSHMATSTVAGHEIGGQTSNADNLIAEAVGASHAQPLAHAGELATASK